MTYRYTDGNNNSYHIQKDQLRYTPMTKAMSSSGTYSGGTSQTLTITPQQFLAIRDLLDAALADTKIHISQRKMGSAIISKKQDQNTQRVLIRAFCDQQKAIDQYLKSLLL